MQIDRAVVVVMPVFVELGVMLVDLVMVVLFVVMALLVMVFVLVVIVVLVVVRPLLGVGVHLERPSPAQWFERDPFRAGQLDHQRVVPEVGDRTGERDLLVFVDQEDDAGLGQRRGVGRAHAEGVRRLGTPNDQVRLAGAGHHRAHQRVHRLDRGDHVDTPRADVLAAAGECHRCGQDQSHRYHIQPTGHECPLNLVESA